MPRLKQALAEWVAKDPGAPDRAAAAPEDREALRSLGYLESDDDGSEGGKRAAGPQGQALPPGP